MCCIRYDIQLGRVFVVVIVLRSQFYSYQIFLDVKWGWVAGAYLLLLALRDANSNISVILVSRNPSCIVLQVMLVDVIK